MLMSYPAFCLKTASKQQRAVFEAAAFSKYCAGNIECLCCYLLPFLTSSGISALCITQSEFMSQIISNQCLNLWNDWHDNVFLLLGCCWSCKRCSELMACLKMALLFSLHVEAFFEVTEKTTQSPDYALFFVYLKYVKKFNWIFFYLS